MRAIYRTIAVVAAVVLALFAISNREAVSLGLWPLPFLIDLPLYLLVFVALLAGFVVGAIAAWSGGRRRRRELRRCSRRIEALERELATTRSQLANPADRARPGPPARG